MLCQTEGADVTVRGGSSNNNFSETLQKKTDFIIVLIKPGLWHNMSAHAQTVHCHKRLLPCNFKENGMFCGLLPRKGEYGLDTHSHSPCFTGHQLLALDCFSLNVWSACSATNSQGFVVLKEGGEVRIVHMTGSPESCTFCTF